jgi:hypothetical protein
MSKDLLSPRFKVIADYPGNVLDIGLLFNTNIPDYYNKFPAVFRRMEWWEEIDLKDMPLYVRKSCSVGSLKVGGIYKVIEWRHYDNPELLSLRASKTGAIISNVFSLMNASRFLPATEEEYNDYINSLKNKS